MNLFSLVSNLKAQNEVRGTIIVLVGMWITVDYHLSCGSEKREICGYSVEMVGILSA